MKARQRYALVFGGLLFATLASGSVSELAAQRGAENAPRILVPTLRARPNQQIGVEAAEAIRERLQRDFTPRTLWVISKNDITNFLTASGYNPDSSLGLTDLRQLAMSLRADEIVDGTITRTDNGYQLEARYMIPRGDQVIIQPLPPIQGGRVENLARELSGAVKSARRQREGEQKCVDRFREKDYQGAVAAAREGVRAYENATLARLCMATAFNAMNQPDSVLAVAEEVLKIDPRNRTALEFAAEGYVRTKQNDKAADACANLISVAPNDTRVVERCIGVIVSSGAADRAAKILETAVAENPADPTIRRLQWRVLLLTENWKQAAQAGDELVRLDTAQADTAFYLGQVAAFQNDSNMAKAAETAALGFKKFPNNATIGALYIQILRQQGQLPQALELLNKALAANPKMPRGFVQKQQILSEFSEAQYAAGKLDSARVYSDSAFAALQAAIANGEDSTLVGQLALQAGNTWYKRSSASKQRADAEQAVKYLQFSDQLTPSEDAKFLMGASYFSIGADKFNAANEGKSCQLAREANEAFTQAQIYIPQGGRKYPDAAKQLLDFVGRYMPTSEKQVKAYCK